MYNLIAGHHGVSFAFLPYCRYLYYPEIKFRSAQQAGAIRPFYPAGKPDIEVGTVKGYSGLSIGVRYYRWRP